MDEAKIKQFQKLKELPPMQLRQVSSVVSTNERISDSAECMT